MRIILIYLVVVFSGVFCQSGINTIVSWDMAKYKPDPSCPVMNKDLVRAAKNHIEYERAKSGTYDPELNLID